MIATLTSVRFGTGQNAPRAAKVAALGLGIALLASGCGGSSAPESEAEASEAPASEAAAGALACPEGEGAEAEAAPVNPKGDPAAVPEATTVSDQPLRLGSILPTTGALAFLGPPEIAGVNLAVQEVNEAGGVLGQDITITHRDSGDTTTDIATQSVSDLLSQDVNAIIGAASSGVSKTVINQITGAGVVQFSPANTAAEFSEWDDNGLYWRTAPSDLLQGPSLANHIMACGAQTVGMIVLNDAYGTGLQASITETVEGAGGQVIATEIFNEGDSQFSSQVDAVVAAEPDAIVLISFDQAKSIVPLLTSKGVDPTSLFMVDGNMTDYSADFEPGTLEGAQGTIPGPFTGTEFQEALAEIDPNLDSFAYASESYDAVNLISLAAEAAGSVDGVAIAEQLEAMSKDGEKCFDFAACVTLLRNGEDIDYDGMSGPISFDENGDPSEAIIGIYKYDAENKIQPVLSDLGQL